jgi:hypothetical protein
MNYKITKQDNNPITIVNYEEINRLIEKQFPLSIKGTIELKSLVSTTHDIEGKTFFMNYGISGTKVIIPELTKEIKKKFEYLTKLNLEKLN